MRVQILVLLFVLGATHLGATQETEQYSLKTLVEQALSRSHQITSQKERIEEKGEAASQGGAWQNPLLELSAGAKIVTPDVGPFFQVGLSQLFFFPGKQRLRQEVLDFEKTLEEIKLSETELAITVDVVRLAYAYAITEQKVRFAEGRKQRLELISAYLAGHTFASPQQKATNSIVKLRLENIAADANQLRGALDATQQQLNFYVPQNAGSLSEIRVPWLKGNHALADAAWIERALSSNTELAEQRVLINQATKEKDLSSKEVWPDLTLSAFYTQETAGPTERMTGLSVSIPLPIWNHNQAEIRGKKHKIRAEERQLSFKEKKIESLMQKFLAEYAAGQKTVTTYSQESLASLESQLRSMEKEFRKNRLDLLLFLDLEIQVAETANRILNAQLFFADTIASLHFLGRDKNLVAELSNF
jgi:outer membrane protein TolC